MILEINGKRVEVDDSFKKLSPEEQDSFVQEITGHVESGYESHETVPQHTLTKEEYEADADPATTGGQIAAAGVGGVAGAAAGKAFTEGQAKEAVKGIKDTLQGSVSAAKDTKAATIAQANAELQLAKEKAMAAAPAAAPSAAAPSKPGAPSAGPVENWARAEHAGEFYGGKDYAEADAIAKEAKAFNKASGEFRVPEGGQTRFALPIDIREKPVAPAPVAAAPVANPALDRTIAAGARNRAVEGARMLEAQRIAAARNAAEAAQNKIVTKPGRTAGGVAGAEILGNLEGMYRHGTQGDVGSTIANTIGAAGGLGALSSNKYLRYPAMAVGAIAPFVAEYLEGRKKPEEKAQGGVVGYAAGGIIDFLMGNKKAPVQQANGMTPWQQQYYAQVEKDVRANGSRMPGEPLGDISTPWQKQYYGQIEKDLLKSGMIDPATATHIIQRKAQGGSVFGSHEQAIAKLIGKK